MFLVVLTFKVELGGHVARVQISNARGSGGPGGSSICSAQKAERGQMADGIRKRLGGREVEKKMHEQGTQPSSTWRAI